MEPTLEAGDRLWVLPLRVRQGDIVAARDPRQPDRIVVKRVAALLAGRRYDLRGDKPCASTDSRTYGPVSHRHLLGRAVYRYAPAGRIGWIRAGSPRGR